jgi:hypothetical protein
LDSRFGFIARKIAGLFLIRKKHPVFQKPFFQMAGSEEWSFGVFGFGHVLVKLIAVTWSGLVKKSMVSRTKKAGNCIGVLMFVDVKVHQEIIVAN